SSVGTEAYDAYVKQFQEWEKDVEKRRKSLREKAEREANELRAQKEEEEKAKRIQEAKEAAQLAQVVQQQQQFAHPPPLTNQVSAQVSHGQGGDLNAENVFKEMVNVVMGAVTQQPPPSMPGAPGPAGPPPQLWGNTKITYDVKDPLFLRWGVRAAPAHNPPVIRPPMPVGPCWMVENALKERKMAIAPAHLPPPMFIQPPPPM
ncbi:unnamed protein product, partial [Strongylus vulgaris]